jgi:hypothetical protein
MHDRIAVRAFPNNGKLDLDEARTIVLDIHENFLEQGAANRFLRAISSSLR